MAKIQIPKGTRDFYPDAMRRRRTLENVWREVSLRAGFEEVDGPIFESLDLYIQKSGPEIVGQLYNFEDKGGRSVAIRPEFTPSLARMVAARQAALPRPVKWFNISRVCRYERSQKGRQREFFQWNCDILGAPGIAADAECIAVARDRPGSGFAWRDRTAVSSRGLDRAIRYPPGFRLDRQGAGTHACGRARLVFHRADGGNES